ncbi:type 1 glutamine amidotransferase domain-containing protein [Methylophaga sp.]|jgi:putative intracellular protease/amidase|uniref:type 1 glutamine amidotransferase domain-containing protein n=1 Tax=Methylophaga sp. TaxID=2024840 RepID=UPI0014004AA3|nr:type 1 glutamine amidotransferase domain-containing protein [Methylophaga sp.]MTI63971.1 type 1 glutamine amidotransferase domain-containing protein [Methylophaga sp.]
MHILMVLTSHDRLGATGEKTGFWLEEFAAPYYVFHDAGVRVTLASPKGGQPPLDPKSDSPDFQTDATERFKQDKSAQKLLANTLPLAQVRAEDYDAVFYPGGHGPMWDLSHSSYSISLIESFIKQDKPIGFVCHAPAALMNVHGKDGQPIVNNRAVTGFSNSEEEAVGLTDIVPFLLEDALKARGGRFVKAEDWTENCCVDGLLITGQNPQSSEATAEALLESLKQAA